MALYENAKPGLGNLLSLPWDIRSIIYRALLEEEDKPPTSPLDLPDTQCLFPFWLTNSNYIHAPPPPRWICHGLLATCRQTRTEMSQVLRQVMQKEGGLKCKMDCMLLRNNELFPSWTWFPAPSRYLTTFELSLRIITADAPGGKVAKKPGGLLSDPVFKLVELLEEFFYRGPSYKPTKVMREDVKVRKLIINIHALTSEETLQPSNGLLLDGSTHPEEIFRVLTTNYVLPRHFRASVECLSMYYKSKTYHWSTIDDKLFWLPRKKRPATRRDHSQILRTTAVPQRRSTRRRVQTSVYGAAQGTI